MLIMMIVPGIMRPDELSMFQRLDHKVSANKWFLPLIWTSDILKLGLEEGRLRPQCVTSMLMEVVRIREALTTILSYDWVSVPLVYTQLVTLAVYSYFLAAVFGAQWVQPEQEQSFTTLFKTSVGSTVSQKLRVKTKLKISLCYSYDFFRARD